MTPKKVDVLGWYGRHNVGDDAFYLMFSGALRGHDVHFITPPNKTRSDADLVILGGGAVANSYYLNCITPLTHGKCLALGIDVEWEKEAEALFSYGFDHVVFRDKSDYVLYVRDVEQKCAVDVDVVSYCPDLAFSLKHLPNTFVPRYRKTDKLRAIAVMATDYVMPARDRDLYYCGPRADQFAQGLGAVLDKLSEKVEVILLPCSTGEYGDDRRINYHIASFMRHPPTIVTDRLGPKQMIDTISTCQATVCMRFHAHVFSLIAGVPFASIEFTKKARTLVADFQTKTNRPLTAVIKKEDGFFDFDYALENINSALDAGTRNTERTLSLDYVQSCRERVDTMMEQVLRRYLIAV